MPPAKKQTESRSTSAVGKPKAEKFETVESAGLFGTPWVPTPVTYNQALAADIAERQANVVNATANFVTFNPNVT